MSWTFSSHSKTPIWNLSREYTFRGHPDTGLGPRLRTELTYAFLLDTSKMQSTPIKYKNFPVWNVSGPTYLHSWNSPQNPHPLLISPRQSRQTVSATSPEYTERSAWSFLYYVYRFVFQWVGVGWVWFWVCFQSRLDCHYWASLLSGLKLFWWLVCSCWDWMRRGWSYTWGLALWVIWGFMLGDVL